MNNNIIFKNESATDWSASTNILIIVNVVLNTALMLIGITGNSLVIAAIFRTPTLRSPFTTLLCSLAASDLVVGFVAQPVYIANEMIYNSLLGYFSSFLSYGCCGVSLCTMTTISLDRFTALHYHMRYVTMVTTARVVYSVVIAWLVIFFSFGIVFWNFQMYFLAVIIFIVICLLISAFCYIRIFQIAKRHQTQIQAQQQAVQSSDNLNTIRLKKSSMNAFEFYVVLILCYFPMFMFLILYRNSIYNTFYWNPEWHFIGTVVFMNSSINPFLYYWRLGELRKAIQKTARTIFFRKQDSAE